jgi:hypothetical protein
MGMTGIVAVTISFTLYVLTHWAICRWGGWRPHSRAINVLWLCFLPVYGLMFYVLSKRGPVLSADVTTPLGKVDCANGLLLDVLLLFGYTYFFFLVERGLSLRVMIEIGRAPQGKMTISDIQRVYPYDYIIDKRLGQMVKMGYAKIDGDVISGTAKSAKLAAANKLVRKILRVEQVMP